MDANVPFGMSSPSCPLTVTRPGFVGCLNCRWLPLVITRIHPSSSSIRITSRTFTLAPYPHVSCSAFLVRVFCSAERERSPASAHPTTRASRVERPVGCLFFVVVLCPDRPPPTSVRQVGAQSVVFGHVEAGLTIGTARPIAFGSVRIRLSGSFFFHPTIGAHPRPLRVASRPTGAAPC